MSNNSNKGVDVLAVMAIDAADARQWRNSVYYSGPSDFALRESGAARAAVAELLAAADPLTNALRDAGLLADLMKGLRPHERDSFSAQLIRLQECVARCRGDRS